MAQYLAKEHLNSEGEPDKKTRVTFKKCSCKKKVKPNTVIQGDNDDSSNDSDFVSGSSFFSSSLLMSFLPSQSHKLAVGLKSKSVMAVPLLWKKLRIKTALGDSLHSLNHHLIPIPSSKKLRLPLVHNLQLVGAVIIRRLTH